MKAEILKCLALSLLFIVAGFVPLITEAQNVSPPALIIGTKEAPPFSMKNENGEWTGITIELWRKIADSLNLAYEFRERPLPDLIEGVSEGSLDAAAAALTITADRERMVDFTHPFYTTGLGIAVAEKVRSPWVGILKGFISFSFLEVALSLAALLFAVGFFMWLAEHRSNPSHFEKNALKGIGSGFWWSAVTMTTVGYGDKVPVTPAGRFIGVVWMFAGIILVSGFTAAIASSLTVARLETKIKSPADLIKVSVGTIEDTTSEFYLKENNIYHTSYNTPHEGLKAVQTGEIDAFVYDAPILRYLIRKDFNPELKVLDKKIARQDYGIALPVGSPLRESVNRAMLSQIKSDWWQNMLQKYLGDS